MARYKATARGFAGRLVEAGEEFDFDGPEGSWMEPLDPDAQDQKGGGSCRAEVKAALDALGVDYNVRASTEALQKLLEVVRSAQ